MNKRWTGIIALVLLGILLTSCTVSKVQERHIDGITNDELKGESPVGHMRLLTISSGIMQQFTASTATDVYRLRGYANGTASILKYDTKTKELNYLQSEKPIVEDVLGGGVTVATDDSLLVFKMGHVPFEGYDGLSSRVYRYSFEGVLQNTVELPSNFLFKLDSSVAYDGQNIYVILEEYDIESSNGPILSNSFLSRIDVVEGNIEKLAELGIEKSNSIAGVSSDGIMILTSDRLSSEDMSDSGELLKPMEVTARNFSLSNFGFSSDGTSWINGTRSGMFDTAGRFLYFEDKDPSLKSVDINTGEEETLIDNINITGDSSYRSYVTDDIYDNHLMCTLDNGKDAKYIAVNLNTNDIIELKLTYKDDADGTEYAVQIVDETEEYFIVLMGVKYVPTVQYGGGNEYKFDEAVEDLRMISKSDFWKSSPNYIEFQDNVYK